MAFKCSDKYDSWINPGSFPPSINPNDGVITIGTVNPGGTFKGSHKDKNRKDHPNSIDGKCEDTPHHYIAFDSVEDGVTHHYEGAIQKISGTGKTWVRGTHSIVQHLKQRDAKRALDDGDDDWVGTHTT
jgi:hypothetical protein